MMDISEKFTSLWVFYITFKARVKAFSIMDKQFLANLEAPVGGSRATARELPREDDWTVRTITHPRRLLPPFVSRTREFTMSST